MQTVGFLIVLVLGTLASLGVMHAVLAVMGTIGWSVSGEAGALMHCGFGTRGHRIRRTIEVQTILSHVALATRLNLPLPAALRAAARGETTRVASSLKYMAYLLGTGLPVSEAVGGVSGCPPLLVSVLKEGERCGQLSQSLAEVERMLDDATRGSRGRAGQFAHAGTYAVLMFVFCLLVMTFVMVKLIPMFKNIFLDYDTSLPWITLSLISTCDWLLGGGAGIFLMLVALPLAVLAVTIGCTTALSSALSSEKSPLPLRVIGAVRWAIPITRNIDFGLGMATAIKTLSFGLRTGLPLDRVADLATTVGGANHLRRRLAQFAANVRAGVAPRTAAKSAGLGDVFASALAMIERGEDAETALTHAADYYRATANRWWHALSAVVAPATTLLVAAMVGYIALALFLPLVHLIDSVGRSVI